MKDPFTGPGDKEQPYGVNFEGAPSPPPRLLFSLHHGLGPPEASTTSQVQLGLGTISRVRSGGLGFGELREGGGSAENPEILQDPPGDRDGVKVTAAPS